jgi:hypothetical protein
MGGMMGGGGKGGGTSTGGGVSPEQQALAQYTFGENVIGDRARFAGTGNMGMGPSTNLTLSVAGSRFKEAKDLAEMSDKDFKAMQAFNNAQQNSLAQTAGQAGQLLGGLGGGGGGGGGSG